MDTKSELLATGIKAVKAAEHIIINYFEKGVSTEFKHDLSPVTAADKEAEEIIKKTIAARFPDHTFYGEEGEKVDLTNHHGFTWIIDPIDGTKSFVRKNPMFSTLLALMQDGEIILGISNMPLLNELAYAEKGCGSYLNDQRICVADTANLTDTYLSHGSLKLFEKTNNTAALAKLSTQVHQSRGFGDAWSYHLLAQGKIDSMIEADCKLWDIAAAKIIIEEAGGTFTEIDGKPITAASTSALATNGPLHQEIAAFFTTLAFA